MSEFELFFEEIEPLNINKEMLQNQIEHLIKTERKSPGNISVIFCKDDYLLKINEQYLGHDYYTDIVTFGYEENSFVSGDLFISIERVADNAKQFHIPFKEELYRVIFHGVLHLIGYNDKTNLENKLMREKENFYLTKIDFNKEDVCY